MKNLLKNKLLWISLLILMLLSTCSLASDVEPISTTQDNLEEESLLLSSDLYTFDTDVTIDKIIDGNAFILGTNVIISGEIGGDVFICADTVNFTNTSYVHGSIFACAQTITIAGNVSDLYIVSDNFNLEESSIIGRDLRITSSNVSINGRIKRDAYISTNNLQFAKDDENLIGGNLNYSSKSEFPISEDIVDGKIEYTPITSKVSIGQTILSYVMDILSSLLFSLVIILLAIWLTPKFIDKSSIILKKKAAISLGIGLLSLLVFSMLPVSLLLFTGGLGISICFAAIGIFALTLMIAKTVFSMACATLIANRFKLEKKFQFILLSLLAVLVISLVELIPFLGGLVSFLICVTGFGIIVFNLINKKDLLDDSTANN